MEEYAKTTDCIADQPYDSIQTDGMLGCGSPIAYIYFISFMLLISMMMMNLFVAVVIEGYAESVGCLLSPTQTKENSGPVTSEDYDELLKLWAEYDPKATGWTDIM